MKELRDRKPTLTKITNNLGGYNAEINKALAPAKAASLFLNRNLNTNQSNYNNLYKFFLLNLVSLCSS